MKRTINRVLGLALGLAISWGAKATEAVDFNFDWQFRLTQDSVMGGDYTHNLQTDDGWTEVRLPHDWVIGGTYDQANAQFAPATGYIYGGGYGWYQKTFDLHVSEDSLHHILFDGVYNHSEVWINGHSLGEHPYGYSPFYYDLTPYLNADGKDNLLVVKIDHTRYADSRWYTGAGIYRNVKLVSSHKLRVPIWGTFVQTPEVTTEQALVSMEFTLDNGLDKNTKATYTVEIVDPMGVVVATQTEKIKLAQSSQQKVKVNLTVDHPQLWGIDDPKLYQAVTTVYVKDTPVDQQKTRFGIRTIRFDANEGFFLNGENMKIKGVCLHHDGGLVGTAVPRGVWARRFKVLKEAGCNAIRISHNPGSEEFLQLCDEMGFLVQDEFFDEWDNPKDKRWNTKEKEVHYETQGASKYFQEWAESDLKSVMLAHRNHPSIIQWSIGNEIEWTYPRTAEATGFFNNMDWNGNYFWSEPPYNTEQIAQRLDTLPRGKYDIGETAQKLAAWTREMDTSRPVVANCILPSASHLTGYGQTLDIVGYSYRRILYDYGHENYPDKVIMGTENLAQYHEWKAIMERPFISGTYLWTGIDYLGEIRGPWPKKGTGSGIVDFAGFAKPSYYMMKSLWNEEPSIYIATQTLDRSINAIDEATGLMVAKDPEAWQHALWEWHDVNNYWEYEEGEMISVELYSNCDEIELFLNDSSLGKRGLSEFEDHIYKWAVPFAQGELKAVGMLDGTQIEEVLYSTTAPYAVELKVDQQQIDADGYDVVHVVAQLVDRSGRPVKDQNRKITFDIAGEARLLGVDTGSVYNVQQHSTNALVTDQGRALMIFQSIKGKTGEVKVTVSADGLEAGVAKVTIK
ncbi:glycoside hydrolase family 2 TIM barrel-domain containing protein [Reichenbachiella agariperforans]|uniref:glycoside hydrolase family 2 TIM barrel-domain containing protein n=1 Tax=Reichenbachiella agariperforans TaxID=156994 RepID=UPI001C09D4B5|nr:glycoside hydrolase family 2 TIM barrel-domain containing protein [Reichenbachiella agariperforans]MBU2912666.1 DUF4982 domain-containing protein [Reichenbachiella agariperforans]